MANEKRLIDANALLEKFKDVCGEHFCFRSYQYVRDFTSDVANAIREAPTVDAVEVVHGKWNAIDECANSGVYCSVCHRKIFKECYGNCKLRSNYCPNCGAKMDGDGNA